MAGRRGAQGLKALHGNRSETCDLQEVLGEGGFGAAYKATRHRRSGGRRRSDEVCVKLSEQRDAWHRECYFGELLRGNKRAVQVLDDFPVADPKAKDGFRYALVTEYAAQGSLDDYLDELSEPWPEARIRREVRGILSALDQLHRGRAMHRDLTPMNVFVTDKGQLKLGDFGIAIHAGAGSDVAADVFNPWFAPTATALREGGRWGAVDDVWQVGQLLAMLVRGLADPIDTSMVKTLRCSGELRQIIRRAIDPKALRYPDAFSFAEALRGAPPDTRSAVRSLVGRNVVFTGTLWTRRADATRLVESAGGRVSKAVSRQTDVLVCGAPSPSYIAKSKGMKRIEAEALNEQGARIAIVSESQFRRLVR